MAPCLVVERLEGQHRCSRAPVGEHAVGQARQYRMWLFTRNKRSAKNNKNLHCGSPSHYHDRAQLRQHPLRKSRSQSTRSMAGSGCLWRRRLPTMRLYFYHFRALSISPLGFCLHVVCSFQFVVLFVVLLVASNTSWIGGVLTFEYVCVDAQVTYVKLFRF